jgi:hypothetical protein
MVWVSVYRLPRRQRQRFKERFIQIRKGRMSEKAAHSGIRLMPGCPNRAACP